MNEAVQVVLIAVLFPFFFLVAVPLSLILLIAYLTAMFGVITIKKDPSVGNFTWGGIVMILALCSFYTNFLMPESPHLFSRQSVATFLTMLWGLRLAIHTYSRYRKGADPRFIAWQKEHPYGWIRNIGWIFGANGLMGLIMSMPILIINYVALLMMPAHSESALHAQLVTSDIVIIAAWCIGFFFESVSDYQLYRFTHNPANKNNVLDTGLWRYSRHPNYFGEIVMWWSMAMLALPIWPIVLITPITITIMLLFFTGIPWLEKAMADNAAYQEYARRTNTLIPWPPKN